MKTKLLSMALMAGSTMFAGVRFGIGVNVGVPAPVVAVGAYRPPCPGPGYVWVDGYNDAYGNFVNGYWSLPPYAGAYWVGPSYAGGRFVGGYWGGARHFDRDDFHGGYRPQVRNDFHGNDGRNFHTEGRSNNVQHDNRGGRR